MSFLGGAGLGLVSVASTRLGSRGGVLTVRGASTAAQRLFALPGVGLAEGVAFIGALQSDLGAEQQAGDRTAILASPQVSRND